jgi:hypothetical protein
MAVWLRALGVVLLLNGLFLALALVTAMLPREGLRDRVREGFAEGSLDQRDWLAFDTRRGMHQYDECLLLQMLTNEPGPVLAEAMGPRNLTREHSYSDYCRTLHELVVERAEPAEFTVFPYTRYWHGYMPVTATMLAVMPISTARRVLHALSYTSLLLLLAVSLRRHGMLRVVGLSIACVGILFWGLPYYGQLFAHAPGDMLVVLGIAGLVAGAAWLREPARLVPFSAAYGALVVYLEFLTGQLPTAAAFLFAATYAMAVSSADTDTSQGERPARRDGAWRLAMLAVAAFTAGAVATVVVKQALAAAVLGTGALNAFSSSLGRYMGQAPTGGLLPELLRPFSELFRWGRVLAWNSTAGAAALYGASALAWLAAIVVAVRVGMSDSRSRPLASDVLALAVAASMIVAWVLLLQNHTFYHARFMVRIVMAPIALGAAALAWAVVVTARSRRAGSSTAAPPLSSAAR